MIAWLVRGLLLVAGFVTSWFVTKDSPQFGVMETAVTLLLIVLIVEPCSRSGQSVGLTSSTALIQIMSSADRIVDHLQMPPQAVPTDVVREIVSGYVKPALPGEPNEDFDRQVGREV
jgi:hypothetical protein